MKNGWKAQDHQASAIVPPRPLLGDQLSNQETKVETAPTTGTPESQQAPAQASFSAIPAVYKGSTPDARGLHNLLKHGHPLSTLCTPLVHGVRVALAKLRMLDMPGAHVWRTNLPDSSAADC
jgi:hypothetical protein